MIEFLARLVVGGAVGVFAMALFMAAADDDRP
jgi:hypothetical protein